MNGKIPNTGKGFTLVEMIVVVAITAILLAIGMPAFQSFIQNAKIRSTAENFEAGLQLARNEAMRRNARVSLWLVNDVSAACALGNTGPAWVVSQDNPAGSCNAAASDTASPRIIQTRSTGDGVSNINISATDSANAASSCITFNGFGRVESSCTGGGNPMTKIEVRSSASGARLLDVRVPLGGSIRMCDPSAPNTSTTAC